MAKLGQLLGLTAFETVAMSTFEANVLAHHMQDAMIKSALANPKAVSPAMLRAVRSRTSRVVRGMREARAAAESDGETVTGLGAPPEED